MIAISPEHIDAWFYKGNMLLQLNRSKKAIEAYDKVLSLDPSYAPAWVTKGQIFDALDAYDKAISCYEQALKINPADITILPLIGIARSARDKTSLLSKRTVKQ